MTLLIKNVRILGGAREFPEACDVFVNGDRISAIGNFPKKPADEVLDGQGAYLSPGFIDVNTSSDHYLTLFEYPSQEDFLRQGITTTIAGMCGASLAPLMYGQLESLRKWGAIDRVNVNWHTMTEFLQALDKRPLGVNFGTLVGHATIRRAIVGDTIRDLTKNELQVFKHTLREALDQGGLGLSSGLGYVHAHKTPYAELKALVDIVREKGGVYATHLRDSEAGVVDSVEETIKLARETGAKTLISHFAPHIGFTAQYQKAFEAIESLPPDINLRFDTYPSAFTMMPIYTFLPTWAQDGGFAAMRSHIQDEWMAAKITKDMPKLDEENIILAQAPIGSEFLVGRSLRAVREIYNVSDPREALLRLMIVCDMKGAVLYKNLDDQLIKKFMAGSRSFIASNAPSFGFAKDRRLKSERTTRTFTKFLSFIESEQPYALTDAIRKITLEPAQFFGLQDRGEIKEGNIADLTCFRGEDVKFTVVNGAVAMQDREYKGTLSGKALRRSAKK
ncbi:MAG TPA: amidohydrolase family protein [Candidatus Paceibacterota bacterium]|nr:amidohydrolase family protein [Candidatus Paceibacterota bacterium]